VSGALLLCIYASLIGSPLTDTLENASRTSADEAIANLSREVAAMAAAVRDLSNNVATALVNTNSASSGQSNPSQPSSMDSMPRKKLLPQLDQANYQNIVHWSQDSYLKLRKPGEGTKLEDDEEDVDLEPGTSKKRSRKPKGMSPVTSSFMEDEDGQIVSREQQDAVRARAREPFNIFLTWGQPIPAISKKVDVYTMDEFINIMEENHPFLRLCENHWKSRQVFRTYYPPWHDTNVKKLVPKEEVIDVDADDNNKDEGGPSKRPRLDHGDSTRPTRSTPPRVTLR